LPKTQECGVHLFDERKDLVEGVRIVGHKQNHRPGRRMQQVGDRSPTICSGMLCPNAMLVKGFSRKARLISPTCKVLSPTLVPELSSYFGFRIYATPRGCR
jgi:hypothetical protein